MVKIIYGVSGEGSGHSSRAREMISYLESQEHQVKVVSYDRGYRNLKDDFDVLEIVGLTIVNENNKVSMLKTLTTNLEMIPKGLESLKILKQLILDFEPDCIITDFEPMTAYLAGHYRIPLISLDNQHRMRCMVYPCPPHYLGDSIMTETIVRAMVPKPSVCLITTFYFGALKNQHSFLFPPILRQAVQNKATTDNGHVLVYVNKNYDTLLNELSEFGRERFYAYGFEREGRDQQFEFKAFSREGFLDDLASCKAVIATAGFTLLTEALYLGKPIMILPIKGQFEQELNGVMLDELGYGKVATTLSRESIAAFLYQCPDYQDRLASYPRNGNQEIQKKLEELLAENCKLLLDFHNRRR